MKAGTTPLAVHVPEMAPIIKRMRMAMATSPMFSIMAFSNAFQGVLYSQVESAIQTPAPTRRATWEDPAMESAPQMTMVVASSITTTPIGMSAISVLCLSVISS